MIGLDGVKPYDPEEPVSVTMSRQQWATVRHWLTYGVDYNKGQAIMWENLSFDKKKSTENAAKFINQSILVERLCKIIDESLEEQHEQNDKL